MWDDSCPEIPMRLVLAGRSGSGKPYWLCDLLKRKKQPFQQIFIIAPVNSLRQTAYKALCAHFDGIKKNKVEIFPHENLPSEEIRTAMLEAWSEYPDVPKLVIIDDLLSDISRETEESRWVQLLYTSGRHINVSVVTLVQNPFPAGCGRTERLNSTMLCLWSFPDVQCVDRLLSQISDNKQQKEQAGMLYKQATSKVGGCLIIDLTARRRGFPNQMFRVDSLNNYANI